MYMFSSTNFVDFKSDTTGRVGEFSSADSRRLPRTGRFSYADTRGGYPGVEGSPSL
jgi:hypothetical protein